MSAPGLLPTLPVFGWDALKGERASPLPCLLDHERLIYTNSGRASILLALEQLGVGRGDRVLLPTYHCPTMVAPVVALGAEPEFYAMDLDGSPLLDRIPLEDVDAVKAILVAHLFGIPQAMKALRAWCDAHRIALIEDCAHALFGRAGERPIGHWGDYAIASLPKFLPVPEGGCLAANRPMRLALSDRSLIDEVKAGLDVLEVGASYGRVPGLNHLVGGGLALLRASTGRRRTAPPSVAAPDDRSVGTAVGAGGDDFRIDVGQAHRRLTHLCRLLASKLPRQRIAERRQRGYLQLASRFEGRGGLRPLRPDLPEGCAPYVFPLWVDQPDPGYAELRRRRVPVFRWDRRWPGVRPIEGDQGSLWSHHVLQLACHQDLTEADLDRYVDIIVDVFRDRSEAGRVNLRAAA